MTSRRDTFTVLFEASHRADEEVEHAAEVLQVATTAQRRAHSQLWEAIHDGVDAQSDALDLRQQVEKLQTLVLELTAKLNGGQR